MDKYFRFNFKWMYSACFIIFIWMIMSFNFANKDYEMREDYSAKNINRTIITLEEDKYGAYSYCSNKEVNEYKGWREHFISSESNTTENNYIPTNITYVPVGLAAAIPTGFLIEESDFCIKRPSLKAIVYVHTAIKNTERRSITRATWGRASDEVAVIFVFGLSKDKEEESIISSECLEHHDIIQGNYTDLYQLLVYKNLNALYWIMKHCNQVKWVVHADDDVLFDVTKFLSFTNGEIKGNYSNKIFCNLMCAGAVVRDANTIWEVSKKEYPFDHYPIYCMGNLWFATKETAKRLLDVVPLVKYLWVDDTYVTGLLAERAEIQRYRIDIPDQFQQKDVGQLFGWRQIDSRIERWNYIVSYYKQNEYNILISHNRDSG